jgi:hypothetical protein
MARTSSAWCAARESAFPAGETLLQTVAASTPCRASEPGRAGFILYGMASIESLCLELRGKLVERRQRLAEEIGRHPRPITACDVHFNRLLEERAEVSAALDRFDEIVALLRG